MQRQRYHWRSPNPSCRLSHSAPMVFGTQSSHLEIRSSPTMLDYSLRIPHRKLTIRVSMPPQPTVQHPHGRISSGGLENPFGQSIPMQALRVVLSVPICVHMLHELSSSARIGLQLGPCNRTWWLDRLKHAVFHVQPLANNPARLSREHSLQVCWTRSKLPGIDLDAGMGSADPSASISPP